MKFAKKIKKFSNKSKKMKMRVIKKQEISNKTFRNLYLFKKNYKAFGKNVMCC